MTQKMLSFTETFQNTPLEQKPEMVDIERQRRNIATPEAYVAVPVLVPKMSSMVPNAVAEYELFWLIGLPGPIDHPKYPGKKAREAINFQCSREETAEDMIYMLNLARMQREMLREMLHNEVQQNQTPAESNPLAAEDCAEEIVNPELDYALMVEDLISGK